MKFKNIKFYALVLIFTWLIFNFSGCATAPLPTAPSAGRPAFKINLASYGIRKIVLDAGHGGNDPGAIGRTGLREKDVNLDIVKRLKRLLETEGVDVVLTRSNDRFIPLPRRVDITNNAHADLFVSIHSNANHTRSMNGFEVYYISNGASQDVRHAFSTDAMDLDKACVIDLTPELKATLGEMISTSNRADSIELAHSICNRVGCALDTRVLGVKSAGFFVLKGSRIPAVLVEIGFVSNLAEERLLKGSAYRQQIAESIADGINYYAQNSRLAEAN